MMMTIVFVLFLHNLSYALEYHSPLPVQVFHNYNCIHNSSCSLKTFQIATSNITNSGTFGTEYTTQTYISYTTDKVENLEEYGVVQFIRGCQWMSYPDGTIDFSIKRNFFNQIIPFHHSEFVIDSFDFDPLYSSRLKTKTHHSRHDIWRHNKINNSFNKKTELRFEEARPLFPTLYARDRLGGALYDRNLNLAKNSSLEFLTCIYKIDQVPEIAGPSDLNTKDSIKCFSWSSSYVYNYQSKKIETLKHMAPICLGKNL